MSLPAAIRHAFRPSPSTDFSHPLKHAKHISLHHHLDFSQRDALQRIFKEDTLDFAVRLSPTRPCPSNSPSRFHPDRRGRHPTSRPSRLLCVHQNPSRHDPRLYPTRSVSLIHALNTLFLIPLFTIKANATTKLRTFCWMTSLPSLPSMGVRACLNFSNFGFMSST